MRDLREGLYPVIKASEHEALATHRQKSHIQITEMARDYLIKKLESLFKSYGVDEVI